MLYRTNYSPKDLREYNMNVQLYFHSHRITRLTVMIHLLDTRITNFAVMSSWWFVSCYKHKLISFPCLRGVLLRRRIHVPLHVLQYRGPPVSFFTSTSPFSLSLISGAYIQNQSG